MPEPNFYIIGAPKCGTETVGGWLKDHSQVFLPARPIPNFHASDLAERIDDAAYYSSLYAGTCRPAIGEVSPWYLFSGTAVENILVRNPAARFVVCVRNPIDMAWVLHSSAVADAREHVEDFSVAWAMSHLRRQGRGSRYGADPKMMDYCSACSLGSQLVRLTALVDPAKIHLVFLDDLLEDPATAWIDLQIFLDLDLEDRTEFPIEDFLVEHPLRGFHVFFRRLSDTRKAVLPQRFLRLGIAESVNGWNRRAGTIKVMPDELRRKISDYLSEDIGFISAISGRDLSGWVC